MTQEEQAQCDRINARLAEMGEEQSRSWSEWCALIVVALCLLVAAVIYYI